MTDYDELFEQGRFKQAQREFRDQFVKFPDELPAGNLSVALLRSFNYWAKACLYQGDVGESLPRLAAMCDRFDLLNPAPLEEQAHSFPNLEVLAYRIGASLYVYANTLFYVGRYDRGTLVADQALKFFEFYRERRNRVDPIEQDTARSTSRVIRGKLHWKRGDYHGAIADYLHSIEPVARANAPEKRFYMMGRVFCLLGQVFLDIGDTDLAVALLEKSEAAYGDSKLTANHLYRAVTKQVLGRALALNAIDEQDARRRADKLQRAETFLREAAVMLDECLGPNQLHRYKASNLSNFARLTEKQLLTAVGREHELAAEEIGSIQAQWAQEVACREQTFATYNPKHPTIAAAYLRRACFNLKARQLEEALQDTQAAIYLFCPDCDRENWQTHPQLRAPLNGESPEYLQAFALKAEILKEWIIERPEDKDILRLAMSTVRTGIDIFQDREQKVSDEALQLYYRPLGRKLAELQLFFYEHYWSDKGYNDSWAVPVGEQEEVFAAFQFAKHLNTYKQLWAEQGYRFPEASHDFRNSKRYFRAAKACVQQILRQEEPMKDEAWLQGVKGALLALKQSQNRKEEIYQQVAQKASYLQSSSLDKENNKDLHLAQIRPHFNEDKGGLIISYLLTSQHLFAMVISSAKPGVLILKDLTKGLPLPSRTLRELENQIEQVSEMLDLPKWSSPLVMDHLEERRLQETGHATTPAEQDATRVALYDYISPQDTDAYNTRLYLKITGLYAFLFESLVPQYLRSGLQRIYFMPDGVLHFLNFGLLSPVLTVEEIRAGDGRIYFKDLDFLGTRYAIAVSPSTSVLFKNHEADTEYPVKKIKRTLSLAMPGRLDKNDLLVPADSPPELRATQAALASLGLYNECLPEGTDTYALDTIVKAYNRACISHLHLHSRPKSVTEPSEQELVFVIKHQHLGEEEAEVNHFLEEFKDTYLTQDQIRKNFACGTHQSLLILAACRARYGKIDQLGQILSPLEAFLATGSKNILFNMHRVGASETETFFRLVLQYLISGETLGEAVRQVKVALINKDGWSHPAFWAAAMLIGNLNMRLQRATPEPDLS